MRTVIRKWHIMRKFVAWVELDKITLIEFEQLAFKASWAWRQKLKSKWYRWERRFSDDINQ